MAAAEDNGTTARAARNMSVPVTSPGPDRRLTCAVCLEVYRRPRLLPCFHTFCTSCLEALAPPPAPSLVCPACRRTTPLPPGGVSQFQSNFYLEEDLARADPRGCDVCWGESRDDSRDESRDAEYRCVECQQYYCARCRAAHDMISASSRHNVLPFSDASKARHDTRSGARTCSTHNGQLEVLVCTRCDVTLCPHCKLTGHEGHPTEDLATAAGRAREGLQRALTAIQGRALRARVQEETAVASKLRLLAEFRACNDVINKRLYDVTRWAERAAVEAAEEGVGLFRLLDDSLDAELESTRHDVSALTAVAEHVTAALSGRDNTDVIKALADVSAVVTPLQSHSQTPPGPQRQRVGGDGVVTASGDPRHGGLSSRMADMNRGTAEEGDGSCVPSVAPHLMLHQNTRANLRAVIVDYIGHVSSRSQTQCSSAASLSVDKTAGAASLLADKTAGAASLLVDKRASVAQVVARSRGNAVPEASGVSENVPVSATSSPQSLSRAAASIDPYATCTAFVSAETRSASSTSGSPRQSSRAVASIRGSSSEAADVSEHHPAITSSSPLQYSSTSDSSSSPQNTLTASTESVTASASGNHSGSTTSSSPQYSPTISTDPFTAWATENHPAYISTTSPRRYPPPALTINPFTAWAFDNHSDSTASSSPQHNPAVSTDPFTAWAAENHSGYTSTSSPRRYRPPAVSRDPYTACFQREALLPRKKSALTRAVSVKGEEPALKCAASSKGEEPALTRAVSVKEKESSRTRAVSVKEEESAVSVKGEESAVSVMGDESAVSVKGEESAVSVPVRYSSNPSSWVQSLALTADNKLWVKYRPPNTSSPLLKLFDEEGREMGRWHSQVPRGDSLFCVRDTLVSPEDWSWLTPRGHSGSLLDTPRGQSGSHLDTPRGQSGSPRDSRMTGPLRPNDWALCSKSLPPHLLLFHADTKEYRVHRVRARSLHPLRLTVEEVSARGAPCSQRPSAFDASKDGSTFCFSVGVKVCLYRLHAEPGPEGLTSALDLFGSVEVTPSAHDVLDDAAFVTCGGLELVAGLQRVIAASAQTHALLLLDPWDGFTNKLRLQRPGVCCKLAVHGEGGRVWMAHRGGEVVVRDLTPDDLE